jgi:hypothetical protein
MAIGGYLKSDSYMPSSLARSLAGWWAISQRASSLSQAQTAQAHQRAARLKQKDRQVDPSAAGERTVRRAALVPLHVSDLS